MAERTGSETILFLATHQESIGIENWELLSIGNLSSSVPEAGIFFYTHDMPLVLNSNIGVAIGLANGTFGKAKGFILDPTSSIYRIEDSNVLVVTKPPLCVFMEVGKANHEPFEGLEQSMVPIFPVSFRVDLQNVSGKKRSCKREQVSCSPAFAMTDYRVQGQTYDNIIVDLVS